MLLVLGNERRTVVTVGLIVTSLLLGLRHGFDWDHIAAIADLSGSTSDRRKGLWLSTLYAFGHALVVFVLGVAALVAGAAIPERLDSWMGVFVGLTLIWLGLWVLIDLARHGRQFRLRSRWMLILDGTFAGWRRVAKRAGRREITMDHEHQHSHRSDVPEHGYDAAVPDQGQAVSGGHDHAVDHDHAHADEAPGPAVIGLDPDSARTADSAVLVGHGGGAPERPGMGLRNWRGRRARPGHSHSHSHKHRLSLPNRADGTATAVGVGMLHGVGVESPTQIAVFVASTSVVGTTASLIVLGAWCAGLVAANSVLALLAGFGLLEARRNFRLYASVAVLVALGSIAMGVLYVFGLDLLPEI